MSANSHIPPSRPTPPTAPAPSTQASGGDGRLGDRRSLLVLIDGHALVYRAYHAIPATFMTSRGEPTNAVYGFTSMLLKVLGDLHPDYCAVAFDRSAPTFRHIASTDYKATRPRMADELRQQFGRVREVIAAFNIPIFEQDGYEADDVLGCLASQAAAAGVETIIVTGDMDSLQLVDEHVRVMAPRGRVSETVIYDVDAVRERYGLDPAQLPDLKALAGDPSDNIIGVRGIGQKTAAKLLAEFGTIEQLYTRLDEVNPKLRSALAENVQLVRANKRLATIERAVPCLLDPEACRVADYDRQRALELFQELEFRTLVPKLPRPDGTLASPPAAPAAAPAAAQQMSLFEPTGAASKHAVPVVVDALENVVTTARALDVVVDVIRGRGTFVLHPIAHQRSVVDCDLAGIALALDDTQGWYVPVSEAGSPDVARAAGAPSLPEPVVLDALRPLLEDAGMAKTAHNLKQTITLLANRGVSLRGLAFDTMIGAYVLNPSNRALSVGELVFHRLGRDIAGPAALVPKGGSVVDLPVSAIAPAAVQEARLLHQIAGELSAELDERAQLDLFRRVELPLIPVLSEMERTGVKIDVQVLGEMSRRLAGQIRRVALEIYNSIGHQFTINSPQQLGRVLVDELRLPLTKRTKTGYSTDATVLEELVGTHPVIEHILTYRQLTKLKSTYVDALPSLINPRTGRLHTTFNQAVAATGRLSSDSPNLQNIPVRTEVGRLIRRAFVAGLPDWVLLAADYAQIELRLAAHITRDPLLIRAFQDGVDVHAATASTVFNVPIDQVTPEQRRLAKTTNFAVLYGISDFGLSQRVGITRSEAAPFIKRYLERHTGIKRYIEETLKQARERGYVETPLGRRRYLPELRSGNAAVRSAGERMAINMPIQGAQADLIKLAMIAVHGDLAQRGLRTRMLLQVHDELVFEVPRDEFDEVARLVRERMEGAMQLIVPITVEMKAGQNWYDMEPYESAKCKVQSAK
ncbi:MAG: DNA polymerase I [Chloroflexi bacterium]|nr:DNA polymerase I [Chloroflexota bacterium]